MKTINVTGLTYDYASLTYIRPVKLTTGRFGVELNFWHNKGDTLQLSYTTMDETGSLQTQLIGPPLTYAQSGFETKFVELSQDAGVINFRKL